jgi:hypothetical protein
VLRERPRLEVPQLHVPCPGQCPEAARRDVPVPADRLAHPYREAVRPAYAAAAQSPDFHLQEAQPSGLWSPEAAPSAASAASLRGPVWRREAAEAEASSVASAQRVPLSLPEAAAVGVAACVRAAPRWAEPAGSDAREQGAEAAGAASDARAQPREAAVAGADAEPEEAAAEPDAEPEAAVGAVAAERDAAQRPGVAAAAAVRAAVLRPGAAVAAGRVARVLRPAAARPSAAPSAFHRGQALPWLAR